MKFLIIKKLIKGVFLICLLIFLASQFLIYFLYLPSLSNNRNFSQKFTLQNDAKIKKFEKVAEEFWIYSAYQRNTKINTDVVTVFGAISTNFVLQNSENIVFCEVLENFKSNPILFLGKIQLLEDYGKTLNAVKIDCEIPDLDKSANFQHISIKFEKNLENFSTNSYLPIINKSEFKNFKYFLSICVRPIFEFDNVLDFFEFVEVYRILGVEHFTFYNHSIGPEISKIIQSIYYKGQNLFKIIPWQDYSIVNEMLEYGQVLAQNDCLYSYKGVSKWVLFVDLDEFIIPRKSLNMVEMINSEISDKEIAEFRFQNLFFLPNDSRKLNGKLFENVENNLRICNLQDRVEKPNWNQRTKYMINPELVQSLDIHSTREILNGEIYEVKLETAFSHHYRISSDVYLQEFQQSKTIKDTFPRDQFCQKLIENLAEITEYIRIKRFLKIEY